MNMLTRPEHVIFPGNLGHTPMFEKLFDIFKEVVSAENIGKEIYPNFGNIYLPLSAWIAERHLDKTIIIGINGAQGSGKSTLCIILKRLLSKGFKKNVIHLSIDDLYFSKEKRIELAESVHPLFRVRGVPGTHDVGMGIHILSSLRNNEENEILIPVFDKARDDRLPKSKWRRIRKPVDIVLFEGWCVGSLPQDRSDLVDDLNNLESSEDRNGIWRNYVNKQLSGTYQDLFKYIDYLIMLQVPDMESVYEWRLLQEQKLKEAYGKKGIYQNNIMSKNEITRFLMHFERITRSTLQEMPNRANVLLVLDKQHQVSEVKIKELETF